MKSIDTLFQRDAKGRVTFPAVVTPGCEWVLAGEGRATFKWDGTACAVIGGRLYARHRHEAEKGEPPVGWIHHSKDPAQRSGHGWRPVSAENPQDRYHLEAAMPAEDGTYELVGPRVQGNPHKRLGHELIRHGEAAALGAPRDAAGLRVYLSEREMEGIVFHHEDGRMAKIKARDFGIRWPR